MRRQSETTGITLLIRIPPLSQALDLSDRVMSDSNIQAQTAKEAGDTNPSQWWFPHTGPLASSNAVLTINGLKAFPQAATQEWRKGLLPLVEDASAACGKTFNSRRFPQAAIKT